MACYTRSVHCQKKRAACRRQGQISGQSIEEVLFQSFEACVQSNLSRKRENIEPPKSAEKQRSKELLYPSKKMKKSHKLSGISTPNANMDSREVEVQSPLERNDYRDHSLPEEAQLVQKFKTHKETKNLIEGGLQPTCENEDASCGIEITAEQQEQVPLQGFGTDNAPASPALLSLLVKKSILLDPGSITEESFSCQIANINVILIGLATDCRKPDAHVTLLLQVEPNFKEQYEIRIEHTIADAENSEHKSFIIDGARSIYNYKIYITSKKDLEKMPEDIHIKFKLYFDTKTI